MRLSRNSLTPIARTMNEVSNTKNLVVISRGHSTILSLFSFRKGPGGSSRKQVEHKPTKHPWSKKRATASWNALGSTFPASQDKWYFMFTLHWWEIWTGPVLGSPSSREIWTYWWQSSKRPLRWLWDFCHKRGWEGWYWLASGRNVSRQIVSKWINTLRDEVQKMASDSSVLPSECMRWHTQI